MTQRLYGIDLSQCNNSGADVAQLAEQLICNQQVAGSSPFVGFPDLHGVVPEWLKGADCKSVGSRLRWFKSIPLQLDARVAQSVEHLHGKQEVTGSTPVAGL